MPPVPTVTFPPMFELEEIFNVPVPLTVMPSFVVNLEPEEITSVPAVMFAAFAVTFPPESVTVPAETVIVPAETPEESTATAILPFVSNVTLSPATNVSLSPLAESLPHTVASVVFHVPSSPPFQKRLYAAPVNVTEPLLSAETSVRPESALPFHVKLSRVSVPVVEIVPSPVAMFSVFPLMESSSPVSA